MACLDANQVQEWLKHPGRSRDVDEHLDRCDDCRALVAAAAGVDVGLGTGAPARIGRYRVTGTLGSGAMGVVYAAEDPELARRVALKLLHDDDRERKLLREAQALAKVTHEHVIPVYDVGTEGDRVFLAMELVDGSDLRAWQLAAPRTPRELLDVYAAAGRGLHAAHVAGLVHRDFKPENVLVGADGRVRVTDFGLAILDGESRELAGTPAYMAPEQLVGEPASARSDQFSFCVALHEALHGQRPFSGRNRRELRAAILAGRLPDAPRGPPLVAALRPVLARGLAARPEDRFPSMAALLAELGRDRRARPRRRMWVALAVAAGALAALGADGVTRARAADRDRRELVAAGHQVEQALAQRYQAFLALARPTSVLPMIREITGNVDRADLGLGFPAEDDRRLAELHQHLASGDWSMWTEADRSLIAVADYKRRLVFSSDAPAAFGGSLGALDAVARAYDPDTTGVTSMVVEGDDLRLTESGLLGAPRTGALLLLARGVSPGGVARAVLAQALDADRLVDELGPGEGYQLSLGGAAAADGALRERRGILSVGVPVVGPGDKEPVAALVVSRPAGHGLGWLARGLVAALALAALALAAVARGQARAF